MSEGLGEKENKSTKDSNSTKGSEPNRTLLDDLISTDIKKLDITNQTADAVGANVLKLDTEFKAKLDSDFLNLINSFKSNIIETRTELQQDFRTDADNVTKIVDEGNLSVSSA